jgi:hypothetical protein
MIASITSLSSSFLHSNSGGSGTINLPGSNNSSITGSSNSSSGTNTGGASSGSGGIGSLIGTTSNPTTTGGSSLVNMMSMGGGNALISSSPSRSSSLLLRRASTARLTPSMSSFFNDRFISSSNLSDNNINLAPSPSDPFDTVGISGVIDGHHIIGGIDDSFIPAMRVLYQFIPTRPLRQQQRHNISWYGYSLTEIVLELGLALAWLTVSLRRWMR